MIEIKKIKMDDKGRFTITYKENEGDNPADNVEKVFKAVAHDDLLTRMEGLDIHLAMLTGYLRPASVLDFEKYENEEFLSTFHVRGISIGGQDEDQGVVLSGHRILPNGKAVILNNPFERFNAEDSARYKFMDELILALDYIREEVLSYMDGTKVKEPVQIKIAFTEDDEITK